MLWFILIENYDCQSARLVDSYLTLFKVAPLNLSGGYFIRAPCGLSLIKVVCPCLLWCRATMLNCQLCSVLRYLWLLKFVYLRIWSVFNRNIYRSEQSWNVRLWQLLPPEETFYLILDRECVREMLKRQMRRRERGGGLNFRVTGSGWSSLQARCARVNFLCSQ